MLKEATLDDRNSPSSSLQEEVVSPDLIREELRRIVASRHFRTSRRGKEFLQYVVDEKINGHGDLLKERLIGVQLFGRKPDYATGEDPVVRVQAGDVRRRLESYHADPEVQADILIQIPVGSYAPVFLTRKSIPHFEPWPVHEAEELALEAEEPTASHPLEDHAVAPELAHESHPPLPPAGAAASHAGWRPGRWTVALAAAACLALVAGLTFTSLRRSPDSTLKTFWQPAAVSARPVLICMPKPIVYRPSERLYDQYAAKHPEAFATRESRRDQVLPLAPTDNIPWGDMIPVRSSGPGIGGVVAAVNISRLLTEQGIRFELRFGEEATYADMRASPVVIVGAINTDWAPQLTSEANFVFDETRGAPKIVETSGARRTWKMEGFESGITRDYGLITRQLSGKAGQFLVQVAGISHFGTEAASELLVNKKELNDVLHARSINLQKQNFQIVVSTDITAGRAGPPHVVAIGSW